jgi:hypothetical protein
MLGMLKSMLLLLLLPPMPLLLPAVMSAMLMTLTEFQPWIAVPDHDEVVASPQCLPQELQVQSLQPALFIGGHGRIGF